ncbi:MFS transporter [Bacillus sp. AFS059628]|uniref:MFS transporter n=1 Tax=Bacillus sp. AFS059628 TaxID=2033508 RepID=UPI000BF3BD61|nr:MFS transporter [Bacillus sp. AFS059628]PFV82752.1 MFS transporter [Bacillus sp. AFS059628]
MQTPLKRKEVPIYKNKSFLLLWLGNAISSIGSAFYSMTIMWIVFTANKSSLESAFVIIAMITAQMIVSPVAGVFADRYNRKAILFFTHIASCAVVLLILAIYLSTHHISLYIAILSTFLLNVLTTFLGPTEASVLPEIVGKENYAKYYGQFMAVNQLSRLIGNGLAGFMIVWLGATFSIVLNACTFLFVAICILSAKIPTHSNSTQTIPPEKTTWVQDMKDGWHYIQLYPYIKGLIFIAFIVNIGAGLLNPIFPALAYKITGGPESLGIINMGYMIGGIISGFVAGYIGKKLQKGLLLSGSIFLSAFAMVGLAFSLSIWTVVLCMFIISFSLTLFSIIDETITVLLVEQKYRGRIDGLASTIITSTMPLTMLFSGWIADMYGVTLLILLGSLFFFVGSGIALKNPHIRNVSIETKIHEKALS